MALLQAKAADCEDTSDIIAAKFQDKEISIDEYLEQFMTARKTMHLRKLKAEKMMEILQIESSKPIGLPNNISHAPGLPAPINFYASGIATGYIPYALPTNQTFRHS